MIISIPFNSIFLSVNSFQNSTPDENVYPIVDFWTVFFHLIVGLLVWLYLSRPQIFILGKSKITRKNDDFIKDTGKSQLIIKLINYGNRTAKIRNVKVEGYNDGDPNIPLSYEEPINGGLIFKNSEMKF
jgi:hypothetical protein